MFSIEKGKYSNKNSLCKSGFKTNNNICADTKSAVEKIECLNDDDCLIIVDDGTTQVTTNGECVCSYEGKKFCALTSSSTGWKNYVDTFDKEISSINVSDIHMAYQRGNNNNVYSYWGDKTIRNSYSKFDVHYKNIEGNLLYAIFNDREFRLLYLLVCYLL